MSLKESHNIEKCKDCFKILKNDNEINSNFLKNYIDKIYQLWVKTNLNFSKNDDDLNISSLNTTFILSVTDKFKRAKTITFSINHKFLKNNQKSFNLMEFATIFLQKIETLSKKFDNPITWIRIEWVTDVQLTFWSTFQNNLKKFKRNYFRSGIAFQGVREPWLLLTEMELNANACLYLGNKISYAGVNENNLNIYIKARHGSSQIPRFDDELPVVIFNTAGIFLDIEIGEFYQLETKPRYKGHRVVSLLTETNTKPFITQATTYLSNQVQSTGEYIYGYFPCFNHFIGTYNSLRHASSTYALIEGYEASLKFNNENMLKKLEANQFNLKKEELKKIEYSINKAISYLIKDLIKVYDNKAYVVDTDNEIKLGANAVAILALVKYLQVFSHISGEVISLYKNLAEKLAVGILAMQQDNGSFVHVLDSDSLEIKQENRIIYYDGEAAFALMRLYGLTKDKRWLNCVEKAFDYFISAKHFRAHDHWLSYCSNELIIYKPKKEYFQFAVDNLKGYVGFIKDRITTFPTLLELSMAFHNMLLKLDEHPQYLDVLDGFDVQDFYNALHKRANYLINGFFFPEVAMFYQAPNTILNGFFIRHHSFRVRIDDVEHYLSGLISYQHFLSTGFYPKTAQKIDRTLVDGDNVLTSRGLLVATGGRWLVKPDKDWFATGICIHPNSFKTGCLLIARSNTIKQGYLPQVAVKSLTIKGAGAIVTDNKEDYLDFGIPVLLVNNVRQAVLNIGSWARKYYQGEVIGVTGSAGKTTTVAMLSHALKIDGEVGQTKGSANLPIGIAWNMASISQSARSWVIEMAIGNMALNSQMVKPDIAIITNIAPAHLEYHKTLDEIAIKKSRIFNGMKESGVVIICRDIPQYDLILSKANSHKLKVISYGEHQDSDVRLLEYKFGASIINIKSTNYVMNLSSIGKHMVLNAMAVLAVAGHKGLDINQTIKQLETFSAVEGRGEVFATQFNNKKVTVYNEAYNANPLSMKASLYAFSEVDVQAKKKLIILGDMLELGDNAKQHHLDLLDIIKNVDCRELILVGKQIKILFDELRKNSKVCYFTDTQSLYKQLDNFIKEDDYVLIKASHGIGLTRLFTNEKIS